MQKDDLVELIMEALAKFGDDQTEKHVTKPDVEKWLDENFDRFDKPERVGVGEYWK